MGDAADPSGDTPRRVFLRDLRASLDVWRRCPRVVIVLSAWFVAEWAVWRIARSSTFGWVATAVVGLLTIGLVGTERIWYRRALRGDVFRLRELIPWTWHFFGRFFRLGLLMTLVTMPLLAFVASDRRTVGWVVYGVVVLAMDVGLTFATPSLTFETSSATRAISDGWRILRATWPESRWHAFVPGIAIGMLSWAIPRSALPTPVRGAIALAFGLGALWFKGAVVACYLRHRPDTPTFLPDEPAPGMSRREQLARWLRPDRAPDNEFWNRR